MTKTRMIKSTEVERKCFLVDANGQILGRLASKIASVLRGKHKPIYTPHVDTGDMVVVINAEKIRVTGQKMKNKEYQRYSGYPSGQKTVRLEEMMAKRPTQALKLAIKRMMPKGALSAQMLKKLKIFAGENHPHQAQKPVPLEV